MATWLLEDIGWFCSLSNY